MTAPLFSVRKLTDSELAEYFDKASEIVTARGLLKDGSYTETLNIHDADCRVCLYGALGVAMGLDFNSIPLAHDKRTMDAVTGATGIKLVTTWNDDPNTTVEDVADVLRKTAAYLRANA